MEGGLGIVCVLGGLFLFFCASIQCLEILYYYKIHSFGLMWIYRLKGGGGRGMTL